MSEHFEIHFDEPSLSNSSTHDLDDDENSHVKLVRARVRGQLTSDTQQKLKNGLIGDVPEDTAEYGSLFPYPTGFLFVGNDSTVFYVKFNTVGFSQCQYK